MPDKEDKERHRSRKPTVMTTLNDFEELKINERKARHLVQSIGQAHEAVPILKSVTDAAVSASLRIIEDIKDVYEDCPPEIMNKHKELGPFNFEDSP